MAEPMKQDQPKAVDGKITDEDIERQRRQIGVSQFLHGHGFNQRPSEDGIRHFAFGMVGDDNPLWNDPDYAATTRWRGQIAPPLFPAAAGINETLKPTTPEMKALFKGLYRGVGRYNVGTNWQFFRPVRPGDILYHDQCVDSVETKERSAFSGARTVLERFQHLYVNRDGQPVAVRYENFVNAERGGSKKTGKYADVERHVYSQGEMSAIDQLYAAEEIRGQDPRWWEDVAVGDQMVRVVKGPLGVVDIIGAHLGWGLGADYGVGPLRFGWKTRQKLANFFVEDKYGVPGSMMRVHWDHERAQDLGLPSAYDYAQMRSNWMAHAITNWMGDDAWISAFDTEVRLFNFHGDTSIISGEVTAKRVENGQAVADLALRLVNQRDETTATARATILLPSRDHGAIRLPMPPESLAARGARLMAEAAARVRAGTVKKL